MNFKLVSEKAEEPEIKLPIPAGSLKKQESSRKTSTFALLTMPKPLTVWLDTRPPDLPPEKICMPIRKQQLELDMEQQTGSKLGKEYIKAVYCHPTYLTSMQSTS